MADVVRMRQTLRAGGAPRRSAAGPLLSNVAQYGASFVMVAAAAFLAFIAGSVVPTPALTLIFVLPVVIAGTSFGLGPSVAASLASVLSFDFFFTQPTFTLRMTEPSEIWAAGLLLITAAIVSTVAWQARRNALDARLAAERADELRGVAHVIVEGAPQQHILQAAAAALHRMFDAPAAILWEREGNLDVAATAGGAALTPAEFIAAQSALTSDIQMRARTYPHEQSRFDVWPVATRDRRYVLAVAFGQPPRDRPADADRLMEIAAAFLVGGFDESRRA